ncbi:MULTISPECIES: hypothetical protein [Elizabethkingia]|uniref:hypothetical protein n=1 Tax=Elizabethkingia TaxID=308865 RepID=UPI0021A8AC91|nr:hypothetical protein [Elizabethkingia sp. HX CGY]MCT3689525.1 hypothetical protein [Elizabethkingia anophelis]MCT3716823.1 hypothetical protein [Elizabethkingia anophelis]MCT3730418.1 hypothetical protein [Elizabethkingia anophelis]MCT3767512.1 hypothetical protein [Elizabethkingia anophelis]MCT3767709.1 hypothetical protein [Elizabethkingia anophelis]
MTTEDQLRKYSRCLEALVLMYSGGGNETTSLLNIVSDNVSLEVKLQTAITLSKFKLQDEDNVQLLRNFRNIISSESLI